MMTFLSSLSVAAAIKAFIEKLMFFYLVMLALRDKENVAVRYGHGEYELVATGKRQQLINEKTRRQ